jgi:hypothetical protein
MNVSGSADAISPSLEVSKWERIPVVIFPQPKSAAAQVAREIADLIQQRALENRYAVLGLATGSTPIFVYQELVRLHREEGLSFRNVITFNLDEYYPMPAEHAQSYHHFMRQHLFDHIDLDPQQIHLPDGTVPREDGPYRLQRTGLAPPQRHPVHSPRPGDAAGCGEGFPQRGGRAAHRHHHGRADDSAGASPRPHGARRA